MPACPIKRIVKRDGSLVPYARNRITTAIANALDANDRHDPRRADRMARKVEDALINTYTAGATPSVEDIQDVVENTLMTNGLTRIARSYIIYRHQRAMERAARAYAFEVSDNVPYRMIYEVLRWNMEHACDSVRALNAIVAEDALPDLVIAADGRFNDEIRNAAVRIVERQKDTRMIVVAGPSSSGKTTTTVKLTEQLRKLGVSLKAINIDNYFFDLVRHPIDEFGDYDYETPQALDLELINAHLKQLLDGQTVKTPHYDFKTGRRTLNVQEFRLRPGQILMIDSLHGLYDEMSADIPATAKFRVYVETLGQFRAKDGSFMRWADNRLLRRMIRDKNHRNLKPIATLTHWHYVRRSELTNIIPFINDADVIVNSALPYELPFLRHHLFRTVASVINRYKDAPRRLDAHIRANRVYSLLKPLRSVGDDTCVPDDSLLREFIGGSRYGY